VCQECALMSLGSGWQALQVVDLTDPEIAALCLRTRGSGVRISPGAPVTKLSMPVTRLRGSITSTSYGPAAVWRVEDTAAAR